MKEPRIIILNGKDRYELKQNLAARVEEFFNQNHDELGRFAPSPGGKKGKSVSGKWEQEPHEVKWEQALSQAQSEPNGNGKYWLTNDGQWAPVRYHSDVSGPISHSEEQVGANNRLFGKNNRAIRIHIEPNSSVIEHWTPMSEDQEVSILRNATRSEMHIEAHNPYGPNYVKSLFSPSSEEIFNALDNGNRATRGEDVTVRDVYYQEEDTEEF